MARTAKFIPRQHATGRWYFHVPKEYSSTGKPARLYFKTKSEALAKSDDLKALVRRYGSMARMLKPDDALAVSRILDQLKPYGVSITDAINEWLEMKEQGKPMLVDELIDQYIDSLSSISDKHRNTVTKACHLLRSRFGECAVMNLKPREVEAWLLEELKTDHFFNLYLRAVKAAFNWGVRMMLFESNPIQHIYPRKIASSVPKVLSVDQARGLLASCRDFRGDSSVPPYLRCNASDALLPVAILLFAGVRPQELERLTWDDVFLSKRIIKITGEKSKTGSVRNIHIEDNLMSFLMESVPAERSGKLVPANWGKVWKAVRYAAGISGMHDVCRHSYASYWLAYHDQDMNGLLGNMGHTTSQVTLKHYLTACEKDDAQVFFSLGCQSFLQG